MEGALEICISAFVNTQYWIVYDINPFEEAGSLRFRILNTVTTVVLLFIVLVSPVFFAYFFIKNRSKWCFRDQADENVGITA